MNKDYTKEAYQIIYKHPEWETTAQRYEDEFAANLYKSSYVKESARTVLHRLSSMLMAYYGLKDKQKEEDIENRDALGEIAATIMGKEIQGRGVLEDTLLSSWAGAGQIGDARKANPSQVAEEYESVGGSMDALADMSTENALKEMSSFVNQQNIHNVMEKDGNIREMMTMLYNGMIINGGRTKEEIAQSRSLKNMLLNITENDIALMRHVGNKIRTEGYDDPNHLPQGFQYGEDQLMNASVDFESLRSMKSYKNKTDVFDSAGMVEDLPKARQRRKNQGNALSRWFSGKWRMLKAGLPRFMLVTKKKGKEIQGLGREHYLNLGIAPSAREDIHAHRKGQWGWKEGTSFYKRKMSAKGMVRIAGPSGTTIRMMGAYKLLGASKQELLNFRLALIGWMGTSRDHSLVEILQGSHYAGVVGKEDLTEAATMYQTVDPLNVKEIREQYAPNKLFPHEIIYRKMLNSVTHKRRGDRGGLIEKALFMMPFSMLRERQAPNDAEEYDAGDLALNIYSTEYYQTMNIAQLLGNFISKKFVMRKQLSRTEKGDTRLENEIFNVVRVSARMAQDTLTERAMDESTLTDIENKYVATRDKSGEEKDEITAIYENSRQAYRGVTYRGGRLEGNMRAGIYTPKKFTSTTEKHSIAVKFYDEAEVSYEKKAIFQFNLNGKSAVNINSVSNNQSEQEVLVPPGSVFTIDGFDEEGYFDKTEGTIYTSKNVPAQVLEEYSVNPNYRYMKCQVVKLTEVAGPGEAARRKANKGEEKKQKVKQQLLNRRNF